MLRNTLNVGAWTFMSRISGFVRDMLIASTLGGSGASDSFFLALMLPNFFRRFLAEGAFNAVFIPQFTAIRRTSGEAAATAYGGNLFIMMMMILLGLLVGFEILAPDIIRLLAPGFTVTPARFQWTVDVARIMFPYILFISLANVLAGVLNSYGRFSASAMMQMAFNVFIIGGLLFLSPYLPTPGHGMALGVLGAGVFHFAFLWYASRPIFSFTWQWPRVDQHFSFFLKGFMAAALGAGLSQFITLFNSFFASFLPPGSLSCLFYADRLVQLPLGVIGVALGTALLPALSHSLQHGLVEEAHSLQKRALVCGLLFAIPAAVGLFVLADPLINVLFKRGAFTEAAALTTAHCLKGYAVGLPSYILSKVASTCFFARHDPRTPARASCWFLAVHVAMAYVGCQLWGPMGIALALSVGSWTNTFILLTRLGYKNFFKWTPELTLILFKILISACAMAVMLKWGFASLWHHPTLPLLAVSIIMGGMVFMGGIVVQRIIPLKTFLDVCEKKIPGVVKKVRGFNKRVTR